MIQLKKRKKTIASKLVLYSIIFSTLVSIVITSIQMIFDYKGEYKDASSSLKQIEISFKQSLSSAVWYIDAKQIQIQLESISKLNNVAEVKIISNDVKPISITNPVTLNGPKHSFDLTYNYDNKEKVLGKVYVTLTLDQIFYRLWEKFTILLVLNGLKTFLVSLFTLYIFNLLVTGPLQFIALRSKKLTLEQENLLESQQFFGTNDTQDELEELDDAVNQMEKNFNSSYNALKNNEGRLKDLLTFNSDFIFETNESLRFTFAYSKKNDELMSRIIKIDSALLHLPICHQNIEEWEEIKGQITNQEEIKEFHFVYDGFGEERFYALSAKPIFSHETGRFIGYRGIVNNETDKVSKESEIEEQKEQIRQIQKMDAIGELSAGMAHDFNNILAIISTALQIIEKQKTDEESDIYKKYLKNALNATDKGKKLTNRLLAFSRKGESTKNEINLNEAISNTQDIIEMGIGGKIKLNIKLQEQLWNTFVDNSLLENVIINLCVNARDAMPDGGNIYVSTENISLSQNYKHISKGDYILLRVQDTGTGIPDHIKEKIFEPFFTTKGTGKGTGLGLSMAYGFVSQNNGFIDVESTVGLGTTFYLYLPKYEEEGQKQAA